MSRLKQDVSEDVSGLKQGQARLEGMLTGAMELIEVNSKDITKFSEVQARHSELLDMALTRLDHQEAEIRILKKAL
ncbi:hypothetical protein [Lucifera butyrica]|nr:hypothetical protein [Lucifera butyrica]